LGMFEDDDYSMRIREKGFRVICALDVFVHHFGQAAFKKLIEDGSYNALFEGNQQRYERKWNLKWQPHQNQVLKSSFHSTNALQIEHVSASDNRHVDQQLSPLETVSLDDQDEYEQKIKRENIKWGQHLKVEFSGEWNAWLDHPLIAAHYLERSLLDDFRWEEWVNKYLNGPAEKSFDLGCGAAARSLAVWKSGSSKFIAGIDVSEDRVAEGERYRQVMSASGHFSVADVNKVMLPENTYDLVFSAHSFHHFLKLEHVMEQVSHALTERGLFILEEFVGPTQFQWTDLQMKYTKEILGSLPEFFRTFRDGRVKVAEGRPTPEQVVAVSPFESIRSAEIWPLFQKYFEVVAVRNLGGTIQHLLYNGIVHNFDPKSEEAVRYVQKIYTYEDSLIDSGKLPSDFMLLVGRKRAQ
jgi:ubiquinone/menaquinone biosynthesis C-methylase UbiE